MQYLLLQYGNETTMLNLPKEERMQLHGAYMAYTDALNGLAALNALQGDARLAVYQPYWAARAALLARSGNAEEATEAYRRAIGLESDPAVRRFLQDQLADIPLNS